MTKEKRVHRHKWVLGSIGWDGNCDQSKKYEYRCEIPKCKAEKYTATRLKDKPNDHR